MPRAAGQIRDITWPRYWRVLVAVPPAGQLAIMHAWLDQTCGGEGWAAAPSGFGGVLNDAIAFYFVHAAFAHAFVNRFCCGYQVEAVAGAFPVRPERPPARRHAATHKTP